MPGDTSDPGPSPTEKEIFFEALERTTVESRAAYLDGACRHDPELRRRVEALLANHFSEESFMSGPAAEGAAFGVPPSGSTVPGPAEAGTPSVETAGQRIGRYKLLEQIGEGGMGTVWMAQQEEPVRRRVALKIIKVGMDTREVVARFEAERQALALMDHPNIAKIHDAGATETGRPYFVMELVRGIKFTDYCDEKKVSTRQRLELFVQVCQAVQHAHQKGIIHRDLKPSNILVTVNDGQPVPKIIDFGIAKATQMELTEKTVFTRFQQFLGTPAYMSPEQAEITSVDIDTRSDVYSLGVLLYELLTGKTPFDARELLKAGLDEMRRTIREKEPERPSTRVSTLRGEELTTTARRRGLDAPKLIRVLRGDLDWIVMKCLEKDRARRYETANGLATDLKRHLSNEPVVARPPSAAYRFHKLVRRNKLAFAATGAIAATLVVATLISLWQAIRATRAEELAQQRVVEVEKAREEAEAISTFLTEVFQSPDPARDGRTITVAETLDRAARNLDTLAGQPARRAKLQTTLGMTYRALGLYRDAIPLLEAARDYYLATLGPEHPATLHSINNLAVTYVSSRSTRRTEQAIPLHEETLKLTKAKLGPDHPNTLTSMGNLASAYWFAGRLDKAIPLHEETLKLTKAKLGPDHPNTLTSMNGLALAYQSAGRLDEAILLHEETLKQHKAKAGLDHPVTINSMHNLALAYQSAGRLDQAIPLHEETLKLQKTKLGSDHPNTLLTLYDLGRAYWRVGKLDQAEAFYRERLARTPDATSSLHLGELLLQRAKTNTANPTLAQQQSSEGDQLLRDYLADGRKWFTNNPAMLEERLNDLAEFRWWRGDFTEAEPLYRELVQSRRARLDAEHHLVAAANGSLGRLLADWAWAERPDRGRSSSAAGTNAQAPSGLSRTPASSEAQRAGPSRPPHEKAHEAEKLLRECLAIRLRGTNSTHWRTADVKTRLGGALVSVAVVDPALNAEARAAKLTEAESLLLEGNESLQQSSAESNYKRDALGRLERLYEAWGKPDKVSEWRTAKLDGPLYDLAEARHRRGDFAEAESLYRKLVQSRLARFGAEHNYVLAATASLGRLLADWAWAECDFKSEIRPAATGAKRGENPKSEIGERAREAEKLLRECLAIRLRGTNSTHWRTADVKTRLGSALVSAAVADPALNAEARVAKLAEAESLLLEGNEPLQQSSAEGKYKRDALERLVRLYQAWDKPEKLSEWQQKLEAFKAGESKSSEPAEEDPQ